MLRLTLAHFRSWNHLSIEAPIGQLTLIRGTSGSGKTTILQAITWCLYGNIRNVSPNHSEKAKTKVSLSFPINKGIIFIEREKNPNRFKITFNNVIYEDKVAQSIIDDLFGNNDIWMASCYIGQGCRNAFLTAPNTGKMELLNSIAFHEDDPSNYIDKIDIAITESETLYKNKLSIFNNNLNNLQNLLSKIDITKALTEDKVNQINNELVTNNLELTRLQKVKLERDVNFNLMNKLIEQLKNIKEVIIPTSNLDKYPDLTDEQINQLLPSLQRRDDLLNEINKISLANYDANIKYTLQDYQDAVSVETIYRDNANLAKTLGIAYDQELVNLAIKKIQDILGAQERLKLLEEQQITNNMIISLNYELNKPLEPIVFPEIIANDILPIDYSQFDVSQLNIKISELSAQQGSLQAHLLHLKKCQDIIKCPKCSEGLKYQQGFLVIAGTQAIDVNEIKGVEQNIANIAIEINNLNSKINLLKTAENNARRNYEMNVQTEQNRIASLQQKHKQLELLQQQRTINIQNIKQRLEEHNAKLVLIEEKLAKLPVTNEKAILNVKEIEMRHVMIGKLSSIVFVKLPETSSSMIQQCLQFQEMLKTKEELQNKYLLHLNTIDVKFQDVNLLEFKEYVSKLRKFWSEVKIAIEEKFRTEQLKQSLNEQIADLSNKIAYDPLTDITNISNKITELQNILTLHINAQQGLQFHQQVTDERAEVIKLNETMSDAIILRQKAVETECKILQQVVDSINNSIQNVCETLFNRDININLSLFKTIKTTKNVKPMVNFSIAYQGGVFDNINQMSGGEGDRASLALTLALNRLSSCPLLMLDESLASLDLDMKEAAIRAIKENTGNTVLIVMHDGVEGVFDNVINVDDLK